MSEQRGRSKEQIRFREMRRVVPLLVLLMVGATVVATNSGAADCGRVWVETPIRPIGPDSTVTGNAENYRTMATTSQREQIRYVFNWGDGSGPDSTDLNSSGDTVCVLKMWTSAGKFPVSARAISSKGRISDWSETLHVRVYAGRDR